MTIMILISKLTLYPAHNRIGRGSLELRHSALHFPANYNDSLPRHHSKKKENIKYFFTRVGIETSTSHVYNHTLVPTRHDWPQWLDQILFSINELLKIKSRASLETFPIIFYLLIQASLSRKGHRNLRTKCQVKFYVGCQ